MNAGKPLLQSQGMLGCQWRCVWDSHLMVPQFLVLTSACLVLLPGTREQNFCKPSYMFGVVGPNLPDSPSICFEAFKSRFDCIVPHDRLTEDVGARSLFSQCPVHVAYTLQSSPWTRNCYLHHRGSPEELQNDTNSLTSFSATVVASWCGMA